MNLAVVTATVGLSYYSIFPSTQVLFLIQNGMQFVLSKCKVSLSTLKYMSKVMKTFTQFLKWSTSECEAILLSSAKGSGLDLESTAGAKHYTHTHI
jgi:hypothetical protein